MSEKLNQYLSGCREVIESWIYDGHDLEVDKWALEQDYEENDFTDFENFEDFISFMKKNTDFVINF